MLKRVFLGLILFIVVAVGVAYFTLGAAAKAGIEYAGEFALRTPVRVASVTLSPLNGNGSIRGLTIANPEGYSEGNALALGAIELELDVASSFTDVIEIDLLRIAQPEINYERKLRSDNLRALLANLPSDDAAQRQPESGGAGKQVIIRRLEILGPQLTVVTALGSAPLTLPDIILSDIGGANGGASVAAATEAVLRELLASIGAANLPSLEQLREGVEDRARQEVEQLEQRLEDRVEEALGTSVEDLGDRLRGLRN